MKLRTLFRVVVVTLITILCIGVVVMLLFRMSKTEKAEDVDLYSLVPGNAIVVVDTDNMVDLMRGINELNCSKDGNFLYVSQLFSQLKDHINTLVSETPHGLSRQMNKMLISFHEPDNFRNQVFYCRLGAGDYDLVEQFVRKYSSSSFPSKYFDYKGEEIRIYPMPDDSFIACYITSEFLALSYQKRLIEEVIDARMNKSSLLADSAFAEVYSRNKNHSPATIYLKMHPVNMGKASDGLRSNSLLGGWTKFDMQMSQRTLYFSGINHEADTVMSFMNTLRHQQPITGFPGDILPASTFYFNRRSISDLHSVFRFTSTHEYVRATYSQYIMDRDKELFKFFEDYSDHSITTCMFASPDTLAVGPGVVISVPVKNAVQSERFMVNLLRTTPNEQGRRQRLETRYHRTASGTYNFRMLPRNTIFTQLTGITASTLNTYVCFYKGRMLMASDDISLSAYIDAIEAGETLEANINYQEGIVNLSDSYAFLMMTDLGGMLAQPESYVRLIPNFFFRNKDFFKHFMLSTQFTHVDDVIYPNIVLTYKDLEIPQEDTLGLPLDSLLHVIGQDSI